MSLTCVKWWKEVAPPFVVKGGDPFCGVISSLSDHVVDYGTLGICAKDACLEVVTLAHSRSVAG